MNYYNEIKENLIKCDIYDQVKDYSKNRNRVITYYETGRILKEAGKEYGKNIIKQYSERLMIEVGKKYNERTLYRMRKFYEVFSNEKLTPMVSKLSWSHYIILITLNNENEILYYINTCLLHNYNKRQLQERIKNKEYYRLPETTMKKLMDKETLEISDLVPNPIIIKSNTNNNELSEYLLKQIILDNLDSFLTQLGIGFTYVGNEYKIRIDDRYNYIDILLYNIEFNCYVVVELKVCELKKEHIGQIQVYMNYIDNNLKTINQNKTIGIIICRQDNEYVIKYCSDERIIAREYKLVS